jgi:hypothetical protein
MKLFVTAGNLSSGADTMPDEEATLELGLWWLAWLQYATVQKAELGSAKPFWVSNMPNNNTNGVDSRSRSRSTSSAGSRQRDLP